MNSNTAHTADTIEAAADLLTSKGWTQGTYHDETNGTHCLVGALLNIGALGTYQQAMCASSREAMAEIVAYAQREQLIPLNAHVNHEYLLISFNDCHDRTEGDVVNLLRKTVIDIRSRA